MLYGVQRIFMEEQWTFFFFCHEASFFCPLYEMLHRQYLLDETVTMCFGKMCDNGN